MRRRLIEGEVKRISKYPVELCKVLDWLPKVWIHLNKVIKISIFIAFLIEILSFQYLEVINSSEASIGPAQFMECPLDVNQSRQWFIRLWNDHLANYVREKANEGLHLYQKRASLEDPYEFVAQTWPWTSGDAPETVLSRIENESPSSGMNFDGFASGYRRSDCSLSDTENPHDYDPLVRFLIFLKKKPSL